jgi:glucosylceramidase
MSVRAERWHCVRSARDSGERLAPAPAPSRDAEAHLRLPRVWLDAARRLQRIEGFGGAFTEAAAVTWQQLPAEVQQQVLREAFDPAHGNGYTLCRVHMNSCDFSLGNYAHADVPDDFALEHFNIERDRRALIPFIHAAQAVAGRPLQLLMSPWSPPAWMKTTGAMNHGGKLRPECRAAWAQCYVRFIQAYAAEGIPIWGLTVQNEPMATQRWDSCLYTAEEERDFVRDHLGPALHAVGLGHVKIIVWDHNRDELVERAGTIYRDTAASKYIWGAGFHWYMEDHFEHVQLLHDAWPDKALLFTEGCQEGGPHHGSWAVAERYGRSLINDLNRWTVGWIDWNLLLDQHGGPNHVGNFCSAPLLADVPTGALYPQPSHAALGHFARFVHPGAQRVLCAATKEALECTAFVNPDGSRVVVVMNRGDATCDFVLREGADDFVVEMPGHAFVTLVAAGG